MIVQRIRSMVVATAMVSTLSSVVALAPATVSAEESPTVRISFSMADANTTKGAHALARRIIHAAYDVCSTGFSAQQSSANDASCQSDAIAHAMAALDLPLVDKALGLKRAPTRLAVR